MSTAEEELDYKSLGLKVGIEIHQQLDTKGKLFCRCPNRLINREPDFRLLRTFRPVLGEEGKFDEAMLLEFKKGTVVEYEGYFDSTCTYEFDETPPFECDEEALDIALEIALLLNMHIIDELHICRKNYVDGSVPAGFQRTMIVGMNGYIPLANGKKIGVEQLCLEEDACKKIGQENRKVIFRLDRLGIPLVEVTTSPEIYDPEEAREAALRIGMLLRGTGKVKRQLGATRQDINVSIEKGTRIEIKGVQKLDWIPKLVKNEVRRQLALIKIAEEMKKRGLNEESFKDGPVELTDIFKKTACRFLARGIKRGEKIMGKRFPKMKGLWGTEVIPERRFGTEVANKLAVITGLKGLLHSDEKLEKYKISKEEIDAVNRRLKCGEEDAFVLVQGTEDKLKEAFALITSRVIAALNGVPAETRKALENGNSEFLRDLHGGARLYPDTDSREIVITQKRLERISSELPPYPWDIIEEYSKKYGIRKELIENIIYTGRFGIFKKIIKEFGIKPVYIATVMVQTVIYLRREGKDTDNLTDKHFYELFKALNEGKITKEVIEDVLGYLCDHPDKGIKEVLSELNIASISPDDLEKILDEILPEFGNLIKQRGMGAMGPVMGAVMKRVRGKIDGKTVSAAVKKRINVIVGSGGRGGDKNKKKKK